MPMEQFTVSASAKRFRWPLVIALALVTGCLPFTVSGVPEFCAVVVLPFYLSFLIIRWWPGSFARISLALVLPLVGCLVRLFSSSLYDGSNWFIRFFGLIDVVGIADPFVWRILVNLFFPVFVTLLASIMFMIIQRSAHA